jgi:glycosyltransferase involved in cell wall biosynthesis
MVCAVHNALDVLLAPSIGEGFGVPLIEAQACGTPCIVTGFSAMPEVAPVSAGNWNVEGQKVWTSFKSWQMTPNIEAIVAALEEAYADDAEQKQARRVSTFQHAHRHYRSDDIVADYWKPTLDAARAEFAWRKQKMRRFSNV